MKEILCFLKKQVQFDWCFYIDIDEFLTFEKENNTLENIFKNFNSYDVVSLQWKLFNASGFVYKQQNSVIETFKKQTEIIDLKNLKQITKLAFNLKSIDLKKTKFTQHVVLQGNWCKTNFSTNLNESVYDKIYIRHYITKSFEEFCKKIFVRGQFFNSKNLNFFFKINPEIRKDDKNVVAILNYYRKINKI